MKPVCAVSGIKKNFGGVKALAGVDLKIYPGLVHAIVGENGAGKSTLMKVLVGAEQPDAGTVRVAGQEVHFQSVKDANGHGVAIVFQELSLFPELDVLANLFMGREPLRWGLIQRGEMRRHAQPVLDELDLHIDLDTSVEELALGEQQLVEIAKALLADAKVLILDEPNSALNAAETRRLFEIVRGLRARGVAVIYISHRLEEVFEIADLITVMRNGHVVETTRCEETTIPQVVSWMIGREPSEFYSERTYTAKDGPALRLEGVSIKGRLEKIDLTVAPGEIVGLAGLEGSGVSDVLDVIFGLRAADRGRVMLPDGRPAPPHISAAVHAGIAMIPADRQSEGLMPAQDVGTNVSQVTVGVLGKFGFFMRQPEIEQAVQKRIEGLNIVTESIQTPVSNLSGGNQQKVVIAKWLEANPDVVLLNDPTRGVDVGAKEEIYRIIQRLADEGRIVIFTSTELPEFVYLCDRVLVFYRGRHCGEIVRTDLTTQRLLEAINTGEI